MGRRFLIYTIMALSCLFTLSGCAGKRPHLQQFASRYPVQACSVGVLPLINRSAYSQGDKILYRVIMAELVIQRPWRLALEGDIRRIYRELRLRPWIQPNPEQMQIIASRLGVDLLVGGEILEMEEQVEGDRVNPRLKIQLQVYNGKDGTLLWSTYHGKQGTDYRKLMHFGLSNTVSELGKKMMKEILGLWEEEELLACIN
ncbi:MAG: hypothetical protein KKD73_13685 [Proteobacteria bacterium]|nr:hypothetical protein [Pseudomonadota bacterium]MBU1640440.1 hypothetical protein [Pseudomonadota bacterium]